MDPEETIRSYEVELSRMTVSKMKEYSESIGISPPSGMKKKELASWLANAIYEKTTTGSIGKDIGYNISRDRVLTCDMSCPFDDPRWKEILLTHGVVSVPIPNFDYLKYRREFWNLLTSSNPNVREDCRDEWSLTKIPPSTRGIFKDEIGHLPWMWEARLDCKPIFTEIWGTDNLLSSFDGASIIFPLSRGEGNQFKNWFHFDQGRFDFSLCSIQGVVHLTDSDTYDGGFCFVENSHNLHSKYAEAHKTWGYKWEVIDVDSPIFSGCRLIKPLVKAGSILLFDSRVAHCFIPSKSQNYRMAIYVCMMPRDRATDSEIKKRQEYYLKNTMTGHWCYGPWFSSSGTRKYPNNSYKFPDYKPPSVVSPEILSLIGH